MASRQQKSNPRKRENTTATRSLADRDSSPSSESDSDHSYGSIHRDEAQDVARHLEQGESIEESGNQQEDLPPNKDMAITIRLKNK